ncbi:MAG: RNA polymerase sigma-I factor [Clostridiaceae bacterium]|nr:RNA polymerase sigma-I factor [Clostridiaceae bacterium]
MSYKQLEHMVLESKHDEEKLNDLLVSYKPFIASCTNKVSGKFMRYGSDDELSIAMMAFVQAVMNYIPENGDFLNYAKVIIRNKVIDYYRSQTKHLNRMIYIKTDDDAEDTLEIQASMDAYDEEKAKADRILEINLLKETLSHYGISFWDLESVAPKNKKTKQICKDVICFIYNNPILFNEVLKNKNLPVTQIEKGLRIKRKRFERHRKYILTVLIIKTGDFPYLSEYIKGL